MPETMEQKIFFMKIYNETKSFKIIQARDRRKFALNGIFIFTNPSALAGYDTRSIFKRSLTGLNPEFFFPLD